MSLHPGYRVEGQQPFIQASGKGPWLLPFGGDPPFGLLDMGEQVHCLSAPGAEAGPNGCLVPSSGRCQMRARRPVEQIRPCRTRRVCRRQMAWGRQQLLGAALQTRSRLPLSPVSRWHVLRAGAM